MFVREVVVISPMTDTKTEAAASPTQTHEVTKPATSEPVVAPRSATVFESKYLYHLQTNE